MTDLKTIPEIQETPPKISGIYQLRYSSRDNYGRHIFQIRKQDFQKITRTCFERDTTLTTLCCYEHNNKYYLKSRYNSLKDLDKITSAYITFAPWIMNEKKASVAS